MVEDCIRRNTYKKSAYTRAWQCCLCLRINMQVPRWRACTAYAALQTNMISLCSISCSSLLLNFDDLKNIRCSFSHGWHPFRSLKTTVSKGVIKCVLFLQWSVHGCWFCPNQVRRRVTTSHGVGDFHPITIEADIPKMRWNQGIQFIVWAWFTTWFTTLQMKNKKTRNLPWRFVNSNHWEKSFRQVRFWMGIVFYSHCWIAKMQTA